MIRIYKQPIENTQIVLNGAVLPLLYWLQQNHCTIDVYTKDIYIFNTTIDIHIDTFKGTIDNLKEPIEYKTPYDLYNKLKTLLGVKND